MGPAAGAGGGPGMGQQHSAARPGAGPVGPRRVDWVEGLQLALITTAVAGLQWLRYQLMRAERHQGQQGHHRSSGCQHPGRPAGKASDIFEALPAEMRRAAVQLIDYQLTPVLCDQWRCGCGLVLYGPTLSRLVPPSKE